MFLYDKKNKNNFNFILWINKDYYYSNKKKIKRVSPNSTIN